ncbi:hypothetical protein [Spirosoma rhododendri]|uniref:Uncharacterized protein n=1 Tax=Spirosoma rhododendri TaxID=2728024 RepID=A0A7L5DU92_9BACT|nr:hypothetical protein [Spirosoma rhododendri]QJD81655.1 hypothetical protein HH216_25260 [Spirosoma rhododendri]
MIPKPSEAANALTLEFVADLSYNPRTNQYRIDLVEPFRSELPRTRNFLLLDVAGFTVEKVMNAFNDNVINFYQQKCDEAREVFKRVKRSQDSSSKDIMNEL